MTDDRFEAFTDYLAFVGVLCLTVAGVSVAVFATWMLGSGLWWMLARWGLM